jgi:hypothetical protein
MDRINAFVLIFALIIAPVASLCGAQARTPGKCPPLCPMMHGEPHPTAEKTDEMKCHHGESTKQDCVMKSGCNSTWTWVSHHLCLQPSSVHLWAC